jgi:hypothetical protein
MLRSHTANAGNLNEPIGIMSDDLSLGNGNVGWYLAGYLLRTADNSQGWLRAGSIPHSAVLPSGPDRCVNPPQPERVFRLESEQAPAIDGSSDWQWDDSSRSCYNDYRVIPAK